MQNALFEPAPFDPRFPVAARGTEGSNPAPSSGESGAPGLGAAPGIREGGTLELQSKRREERHPI